jgi:predicted acetyltransferase
MGLDDEKERVAVRAPRDDSEWDLLRDLYHRYLTELSEWSDFYAQTAAGEWEPDHFPDWRHHPDLRALLVLEGSAPRGLSFVAAAPFPHMQPDCDHSLKEFWIAPDERRRALGSRAAELTFGLFLGSWTLEVVEGNMGALAFWRDVLGDRYPAGFNERRAEGVYVFRFDSAKARGRS